MKKFYVNDKHLNNFKKYVLNKKYEQKNLLRHYMVKNNSMNLSPTNKSIQSKIINQNLSQNIGEEKNKVESGSKNNIINRHILTPIKGIKKTFLEPKKRNDIDNEIEFITPIKSKFKLNNLVNSFLYKIYMANSYKKLLFQRMEPYLLKKEKNVDIQIDFRNTQKKGNFYIPIKNHNPRRKNDKKEIGIQNSISFENIFENSNFSNIDRRKIKEETKDMETSKIPSYNNNRVNINYNNIKNNHKNKSKVIRQYSSNKIDKHPKIKNCKLFFNKYDLINKKFAKNFFEYSKSGKNKRYTKIKRIISVEREKMGKILDKLRHDQNNDTDKLKLDLVRLDGYITRKNKKINNNFNLFLKYDFQYSGIFGLL